MKRLFATYLLGTCCLAAFAQTFLKTETIDKTNRSIARSESASQRHRVLFEFIDSSRFKVVKREPANDAELAKMIVSVPYLYLNPAWREDFKGYRAKGMAFRPALYKALRQSVFMPGDKTDGKGRRIAAQRSTGLDHFPFMKVTY